MSEQKEPCGCYFDGQRWHLCRDCDRKAIWDFLVPTQPTGLEGT